MLWPSVFGSLCPVACPVCTSFCRGGLLDRSKISARNRLKGRVVAVEKDGLMAKIKVEITVPVSVTAIFSKEAVEDLGTKVGDQIEAVVKATEVMIAK
jgi:molybdopterin-binding protein